MPKFESQHILQPLIWTWGPKNQMIIMVSLLQHDNELGYPGIKKDNPNFQLLLFGQAFPIAS